jgi:predicted transposase/invertase (TIGR01784 family)
MDSARIIFVELEKFNPKAADMHDLLTGWLSFLKDPAFMDNSFFKDVHMQAAMKTLQYVSADDVTRQVYEARLKTLNDRNSEISAAKEQGFEKGLGEGAKQAKIEMAKNLLSMQLSIGQIAQATGLPIEEIECVK